MKHLIIIIVIAPILNSCGLFKNDLPPKHATFGGVEVTLNGENFNKQFPLKRQAARATFGASTSECKEPITILIELYDSNNILRANLTMSNLNTIPGKFSITNNMGVCFPNHEVTARLATYIGGDVLGNSYKVLDSPVNFFELNSYDVNTKEIRGKFNVTLLLSSNGNDTLFPDTLRFTEGKIHTRLFSRDEVF